MALFTKRVAAVTSAVAISIPAAILLFFRVKRRRERHTASSSSFADVPTSQWSAEDVAQWLRSLGVSAAAVSCFKNNEVDGSVLFLIDENHISTMATKLRDRLIILKGLSALRQQEERGHLSLNEQPTLSKPHAVETRERDVADFLEGVNAIRLTLLSEKMHTASPAVQREMLQDCAERFKAQLDAFQSFSPEAQAALSPLVKRITALLKQFQANDVSTGSQQGAGELEAQLKPLHEMLDGFLQALDSANISGSFRPSVALLRDKVGSQIHHVMQIAASLPTQYGEPLRKKCERIMEKIQPALGSTTPTSEIAAQDGSTMVSQQNGKVMALVVRRLRDVFDFLKSTELLQMKPRERLARLSDMLKEVRNIRQEAQSWNDARALQAVNDVATNVIFALEEMESITKAEIESEPAATEEKEIGGKISAQMSLPRILASVKAVVQVLHSDELLRAPKEVQKRMQSRLKQSLWRLRKQVDSFQPNQNTAAIVSMIGKAEGLVDTFIDGHQDNNGETTESREKLSQEHKENGEHGGKIMEENQVPYSERTNISQKMEEVLQEDILDEAAGEIEKMFEYLKSEEFEALSPEARSVAARKQLSCLDAIEKRCVNLEEFEQLRGPIDIMKGILLAEINGEAGEGKEDFIAPAGSALCANILLQLNQWKELITSADFQNTDSNVKKDASELIISQLQKIIAIMPKLSSQERVIINEAITPIKEWLQNTVAVVVEEEENDDEDFSAASDDRQRVVGQLEEILEVLRSEEFRLASLDKQHLIAKRYFQILKKLEEDCKQMGDSVAPLLPILQRLGCQLKEFVELNETQNLFVAADNTTVKEESEGKNKKKDECGDDDVSGGRNEAANSAEKEEKEEEDQLKSERESLFKTVMEITAALTANSKRNIFLSEEEVSSLRGLLDMVDFIGVISPQEKKLRDEFEAQIMRLEACENNGAAPKTRGAGVSDLVRIFSSLKHKLQTQQNLLSPAELVSVMKLVEECLGICDEQNVQWRNDPQAMELISEVLISIHKAQEKLSDNSTAELGTILSDAAEELKKNSPQNKEQLQPFMDVLSKMSNKTADMSINELETFKDYQEAVLEAMNTLGDVSQEKEDEGCETYVSRLLLGMSDQLRERRFTNEELDRYSALLGRVELSLKDHSGLEAVGYVQEQIKLQRVTNLKASQDDEDEEEEEEEVEEEKQKEEEEVKEE